MASPVLTTAVEGVPIVQVEKEAKANQRKYTDIMFSVISLSFLFLNVYITITAITYGNIGRLKHGVNYNGGICGSSHTVIGYPYLYYPLDPGSSSPRLLPNARRCVRFCPTEADVLARRVVPVTRTQIERNSQGTASTLLEYTVNSPVYASIPISGRLCLPIDSTLSHQLTDDILKRPILTYRSMVGSLMTSWSIILGTTMLSFILGLAHTWLYKMMPRLAILGACGTVLWTGFALGIALLSYTAHSMINIEVHIDKITRTLLFERIPIEITLSFFIGIVLLIVIMGFIPLLYIYKDLINVICRVNESIGDVLWTRPNGGILGSPSVVSIGIAGLGIIWMYVFALLSGASSNTGIPQPLSINRNGSSLVLPLERQDELPFWALATLCIWIFTGFWIFEFVLSLLKFSVCYTATMWYFVEEPDAFEVPIPARLTPSIVSLSIGLLNHCGSFSAAGLWFGFTRPLRFLRAWINSRYYRYIRPHQEELTPSVNVADLLTSNAFVEMAVASTSLNTSLKAARNRGLRRGSAAARLIGVVGLGSSISILAVTLLAGVISFSLLSQNPDYSIPTSRSYVPSPLFASLVAMTLSAMVVSPHIDSWSVLSDALLYCFLLESESTGSFDEDPTTKVYAPVPLRDLVGEEHQLWEEPI